MSTVLGLSLEDALDLLRAEGVWEPVGEMPKTVAAPLGPALPPGRFVNQCGRCLNFRQAARVDLSRNQRIWLCAECTGPTPPAVIVPQDPVQNYQVRYRELRETAKKEERERKKLEREAARKKGNDSVPRVRKRVAKAGVEKDTKPEGSKDSVVRLRRKASPSD